MEDKKAARAEGGRQFQREGPIMEKDLGLPIVVLVLVIHDRDLVMSPEM